MSFDHSGRHGGNAITHPPIGSWVTIKEGMLFGGERLRVLDVKGYLYAIAYRVYVDAPDGTSTWYWPWELTF
mgnify:CR=1 FL=1|tara:strand:+ start:46486 stop:46701 length:216 start_codon:yes stop_codon:yes gene_type:complete